MGDAHADDTKQNENMKTTRKLTVEKNDPRLCIAGTEHLWSVCLKARDKMGITTEVLAENVEHADAVLFAAAPDLIHTLRIIHANAGESPEWIRNRIDAVIDKAEGRGA